MKRLLHQTLTKIKRKKGDEQLTFHCEDGRKFKMYHARDCCEQVYIEDICGDLNNLIGTPILEAEESTRLGNNSEEYNSETWTFYKLSTIKGTVTIRWYGTSNGYYSESVDFEEVKPRKTT